MAKFHLDRLKKKYGYRGGAYTELMRDVLAVESENISRKIGRMQKSKWQKAGKRISTDGQRLTIPDIEDVIPKKGVFVNKAAQNGNLITDELRDRLTKNLRNTLFDFTQGGGEAMLRRRGTTAGRINPDLIKNFEGKIRRTFTNYTKKDPKFGVPSNVKNIAVTEVRTSLASVKKKYADKVASENIDKFSIEKKWIHNASLSKEPRKEHRAMDGKRVPLNSRFKVKNPQGGHDMMDHPHDTKARKNQYIGCNCDYDIIVRKK